MGEVPVDEDGASLPEAEVVAANVEVHERVSLEETSPPGLEQRRQGRLEPAS